MKSMLLLLLIMSLILLKDIRAHRVINLSNINLRNKREVTSSPFHNCNFENCSHYSLDNLLATITDDVTVNITTDNYDVVFSYTINTS